MFFRWFRIWIAVPIMRSEPTRSMSFWFWIHFGRILDDSRLLDLSSSGRLWIGDGSTESSPHLALAHDWFLLYVRCIVGRIIHTGDPNVVVLWLWQKLVVIVNPKSEDVIGEVRHQVGNAEWAAMVLTNKIMSGIVVVFSFGILNWET